jgi:glucose/arabinose dehydrogenase
MALILGVAVPSSPAAPVAQTCAPRPNVSAAVVVTGPGRLQVTITAGTSVGMPSNQLLAIRFGPARDALIDLPDGQTGMAGNFSVTPSAGAQQYSFVVRETSPGATPTVPLIVVDDCGEWPTFVGAGPGALRSPLPAVTASPAVPPPTALTAVPVTTVSPVPSGTPVPDFAVRLQPVLGGFKRAVHAAQAPDSSSAWYVLEQQGLIYRDTGSSRDVFLDLTGVVGFDGAERGLLGLAFHPRFAANGYLYVNYTDLNGNTQMVRYTPSADRARADPASARLVLAIRQPSARHHSGTLAFGPDGYLYIPMGDGGLDGSSAQDPGTLLGKALRIDVNSAPPYAIPPTNPFVNARGFRPEIWAMGLRNPWGFSFDRGTLDLYIGDVGEAAWEEVDFHAAGSPSGENFGWPVMEGPQCTTTGPDCFRPGLTAPITAYMHDGVSCAVIGGFVYRGATYPIMQGQYFFSDLCSGRIWTLRHGSATSSPPLNWTLRDRGTGVPTTAFAEDLVGELYLLGLVDGTLYRIVPVAR